LIQRSAKALCQLHGIIVRPEMHKEQPGLFIEHVAMNCCDRDAILAKRLDDRCMITSRFV
jgi:hypothetical protein